MGQKERLQQLFNEYVAKDNGKQFNWELIRGGVHIGEKKYVDDEVEITVGTTYTFQSSGYYEHISEKVLVGGCVIHENNQTIRHE